MKDNNIEIQYINTQLTSNRFVSSMIHKDISQLSAIIQQKRQTLVEIEKMDNELKEKLRKMSKGNEIIVQYLNI